MHIACLHTAALHIPAFTDLIGERAPDIHVSHTVREDLLAQAQVGGLAVIEEATMNAVAALRDADVVLCTCSTLGPLIDQIGDPKVIRIDRPMMETAATLGPKPLLAICLESTRAPSLALLSAIAPDLTPTVHLCAGAWDHLNDPSAFAASIAASLTPIAPGHDCIILAQASMRVAEPLLRGTGMPVLSSPGMAADAAVMMALS